MKTTNFLALILIVLFLGSCDDAKDESNTQAEQPNTATAEEPKDDCNYNYTFSIDADLLKITESTNLNEDMVNGTLEVLDGVLNMNRHRLELVPKEVSQQKCIQEITLSRNNIRQFPTEILDIPNLKKVDLSKNSLLRFPSLSKETQLESLKISENQIKSISGNDLLKFKNLKYLYLKGNEGISELPDEILELKNLKILDIRQTKFAKSYSKVQQLIKKMPDTQIYHYSKK